MAKHRPRWHRIKCHRSYTVAEAARVLGVCKESIRRWKKAGLSFLDNQDPPLVRGQELKAFGKTRAKLKQKCQLHECYCLRCKAPRKAADGEADFVQLKPTNGNLKAVCTVCHTKMFKRVSTASLPYLQAILRVTVKQAGQSLVDIAVPCPIVDLKRGTDK